MKKRLFLLFCGVMCLFFVFCSCGDDTNNTTLTTSHNHSTQSTNPPNGGNINDNEPVVFPPEGACPANDLGHYWKDAVIKTSTSSFGSIIVTGTCYNCGASLGKEAISLVDFDEWKNALSHDSFSSFTLINGTEYTDFDGYSSLAWRIEKDIYTCDYFFNTGKSGFSYAENFSGFTLAESYNKFNYDSKTKTYVYSDTSTRIELGFADGKLISHSVERIGDHNSKTTTLFLNYGRIKLDVPSFLIDMFNKATADDVLSKSKLSEMTVSKIRNVLSNLSFELPLEASFLENGKLSIYFILEKEAQSDIFNSKYSTVAVVIENDKVVQISLGENSLIIDYGE